MAGGVAIGWYGPLIDLCSASSHIAHYVQLLVFVHTTRPIQKFKSSKGGGGEGALLRTDVQVGDDTRSYFPVSIWHKDMGSIIVSGDIILLQNVKIVRFGDVVEAGTVQFSSLIPLVHPYELIMSKGTDDLISSCRVGITTMEKLKKVIKWVQQTRAVIHCVQDHTNQKRQLMANWKVCEENIHNCSSISEVSCLNVSCKAAFFSFVGEMFLPITGGLDKESKEGMMFIRRRLFAKGHSKLVEDLICLGCKLCSYPMDSDDGSLLEQNRFPLYCQKSSNRLHIVCSIYRPFLLYVWDQSDYIPLLVTNKGAELLFGNITAEKVYSCYREENKDLKSNTNDEMTSAATKSVEEDVNSSKYLDTDGKLQSSKTRVDRKPEPNFYRIWLILLRMLLQQGKNSLLRFEVNVNMALDKESGRFEMVSVTMPCTLTNNGQERRV